MTREPDIVERLHDLYATHPMVMEAADEIERLNRYAERLRASAERNANEIERLKADKINLLNWLNTHHPHAAIAYARFRALKDTTP